MQGLLKVQSRAEVRKLSDAMAEQVRPDLELRNAGVHAEQVFDVFKRIRREVALMRYRALDEGSSTPREFAQRQDELVVDLLFQVMITWGDFSREEVRDFYFRHLDFFESLLSDLNHSRSKSTNVSAVFRPFKPRYLESWSRELDLYPSDRVRFAIHELEEEIISTESELVRWLERVYNLFREAAVDKKSINTEMKIMSAPSGRTNRRDRRTDGMISEASERIYRQRWTTWCKENTETLLDYVNADQSHPEVIRMKSPTQKPFRPIDSFMQAAAPVSSQPRPRSLQKLSLTLTSSTNESLTATRTWMGMDSALRDVTGWIELLPTIWGHEANQVSITYKVENESGESEIALPVMSLELATSRIPALIKSYS
jgi:hypothetical protein